MLWIAEKQYLDRSRATVTGLRAANDELEATERAAARPARSRTASCSASMQRSYLSTITSLARTVEAKDPYTSGHTERVAEIALVLAQELGFDEEKLPAINVGAIIHDIGKIGVPDAILLKPGPLDRRRVRGDAPPPGDVELHRRRARPAGRGQADGPQPPRALRRRLATRTGSPARTSRWPRGFSASPTRSTR